MELVADAAHYSINRGATGLALLAISIIILFVIPLWIALQPPPSLTALKPALMAEAAGSVALLFMVALFLLGRGMLLKMPLRVYDEGLLIQPLLSTTPSIIPYKDISSIELWYGAPGNRNGCAVLSRHGKRITSVEAFRDKIKAKEFTELIAPVFEAAGFTMRSEDGERSFSIMFRRGFPAASP